MAVDGLTSTSLSLSSLVHTIVFLGVLYLKAGFIIALPPAPVSLFQVH